MSGARRSWYFRATKKRQLGDLQMAKRPKIRHLAIITLDPERLARFYEQTFEMTRLPAKGASGSKAVYMTDGYITLALLENKAEGKPSGLNHFGFEVEDHEGITDRLVKNGVKAPAKRPADRPYAETRATDPDGNNFDISVKGFGSEDVTAKPRKEPVTV
jgi:predicted enzyme related to lactoylglutathione lyase